MSVYDPQHVFYNTKYYQRKGLSIQKKPVNRTGPFSEADKKQALSILKAFGYSINPFNINNYKFNYGFVYSKDIQIENNNHYDIDLSSLWSVIKTRYQSVISDPKIQSCALQFDISSIYDYSVCHFQSTNQYDIQTTFYTDNLTENYQLNAYNNYNIRYNLLSTSSSKYSEQYIIRNGNTNISYDNLFEE